MDSQNQQNKNIQNTENKIKQEKIEETAVKIIKLNVIDMYYKTVEGRESLNDFDDVFFY